jgi:HK97 family phage major capsid protein
VKTFGISSKAAKTMTLKPVAANEERELAEELHLDLETLEAEIATLRDHVEKLLRLLDDESAPTPETEAAVAEIENILGKNGQPGRLQRMQARAEKLRAVQNARAALSPQLKSFIAKVGGSAVASNYQASGPVNLRKGDRLADMRAHPLASAGPHVLGDVLRGMVVGAKSNKICNAAAQFLTSSQDQLGGTLVPLTLSPEVVDKARATAAVFEAGATMLVLPPGSDHAVPVVDRDPSFAVKAENAKFLQSDVIFRRVLLTPRTCGCLVTASRELIEDGVNVAETLQRTLSRALAVELDRLVLQGDAGSEPQGLSVYDIPEDDGPFSPVAWQDIGTAATEVRVANHQPQAAIMHPSRYGFLSQTTFTDGSAEYGWKEPSPAISGVRLLQSSNCPEDMAFVADWSYLLWGIREDITVEVSNQGGETFERHQVAFKVYWRGHHVVTDRSAFYRLTNVGIA